MKTSEILDKAADIIDRNGLAVNEWCIPDGDKDLRQCPMCTGGALSVAAGYSPSYFGFSKPAGALSDAVSVLLDRLGLPPDPAQFRPEMHAIAKWNDQPGRTAEQVIAELRAAAASEREAGR